MKLSRVLKKRKEQKSVKILRERKGFACSEKFVCRIIFPKNNDCESVDIKKTFELIFIEK